jgi:hypothetical protein
MQKIFQQIYSTMFYLIFIITTKCGHFPLKNHKYCLKLLFSMIFLSLLL